MKECTHQDVILVYDYVHTTGIIKCMDCNNNLPDWTFTQLINRWKQIEAQRASCNSPAIDTARINEIGGDGLEKASHSDEIPTPDNAAQD